MSTANFQTDVNLQSTLTMVAIHVEACVISHQEFSYTNNTKQINVILFNIFATNKRTKKQST